MKFPRSSILYLVLLMLATIGMTSSSLALASDLEKEKRWATQIEDSLFEGTPLYLYDGETKFLSIYTPAEDPRPIAAIILHGLGAHPDWPQVIHPLRSQLSERGWSTLSVQLPVLGNEATFSDYLPLLGDATPRLSAAIDFLKGKGYQKVALIAHSLGTDMTGAFLTSTQGTNHLASIAGYAAIGAGQGATRYLGELKLPVLDLYGEDDLPGVVKAAAAKRTASSHNGGFIQQQVPDADHFFDSHETQLVNSVAHWLEALEEPKKLTRP
ncbi:MAG: DUF3530 family protein [bacterium]